MQNIQVTNIVVKKFRIICTVQLTKLKYSNEVIKSALLEKMPTFVTRVEEKCPIHSKKCRLLLFLYGFLSFLHLLSDETDAQTVEFPSNSIPFEEADVDEEIPIDPQEERALVPMSLTLVPVEAQALSSDAMEDNEQGDLPICAFPSFCMID